MWNHAKNRPASRSLARTLIVAAEQAAPAWRGSACSYDLETPDVGEERDATRRNYLADGRAHLGWGVFVLRPYPI
jgi:hypothetical protein